ncbi:MAG: glycosyltransferase family 9 protein [Candidatus Omnitrophota bacterium]
MAKIKTVFVYTMTSGLGDSLIMGDLMHKIEALVPLSRCFMIHRSNPHVNIWKDDSDKGRFYNIFKVTDMFTLIHQLRGYRKSGAVVFGLQMAPGSYQGFFLYALLKRLQAIDHIVDFNLINADIVIPPEGDYILEMHLNQVQKLLKLASIPLPMFNLTLPFNTNGIAVNANVIGIHPWSRRGGLSFTWDDRQWLAVIQFLLDQDKKVVVFGKNNRFDAFRLWMTQALPEASSIVYEPSLNVEHMVKQVASFGGMISINSAPVPIGYALNKKMVILNGPTLDLWIPKNKNIISLFDREAKYHGNDVSRHPDFPLVNRIKIDDVLEGVQKMIGY